MDRVMLDSRRLRLRRDQRGGRRAGGVLLEFALVSLVFYLLLAATVELGRATFLSQAAHDAARVAARELALVPLPAALTFEEALEWQDPLTGERPVRERVFDPGLLVLDLSTFAAGEPVAAGLPVVNRALLPLMIRDGDLLRFPGALVSEAAWIRPHNPSGLGVWIPIVQGRDPDTGIETITWRAVLEEVRTDPGDPGSGAFSVLSPEGGLAALRVNVPLQAAALVQFVPGTDAEEPLRPALADDAAVTAAPVPLGSLVVPPGGVGPYSGTYGLGSLEALGAGVRPFRRLIAAQAVFRREVYL
jgi:hypothetical protein